MACQHDVINHVPMNARLEILTASDKSLPARETGVKMAKNMKRGKAQSRKDGLTLAQFAGAKKSKYNKQARLERKAALNAKRVNQYNKLKGRYFENQSAGQPGPQAAKVE